MVFCEAQLLAREFVVAEGVLIQANPLWTNSPRIKKNLAGCLTLIGIVGLHVFGQSVSPQWVATFEASPASFANIPLPPGVPPPPGPVTGTLRYRFGISAGGSRIVVRLSNELGDKPLNIAGASIAIAGGEMNAVARTMRTLKFNGKDSIDIPAGMPILSDPVDLPVTSMSDLIGSIHVTEPIELLPMGASMLLVDGNALTSDTFQGARKVALRPIMTSVLVIPERPARVVVALGDSITDGVRDKPSEPHGWVAVLSGRMATEKNAHGMAAVSAGISGNQVLRDLMGPAALSRLDRDVLSVPGLSDVVLLEGINDIGLSGVTPFGTTPPLATADLIAGYKQIAMRAHMQGVKIFIGTLTPFEGAFYFSEDKSKERETVNAWIRASKDFDGVIDFDAVVRDPAHPSRLNAQFDSGDHLHPSAAGYKAMGDAIDLSLFR